MPSAEKPPEIAAALAALVPQANPPPRDEALCAFRRQLGRLQTHVQQRFERDGLNGLAAARLHARLMDELVSALTGYALAMAPIEAEDRLAVAATGGYGRATLGAVLRYRSAVPDRRQRQPGHRARGRVRALFPLGSGLEGRPCDTLDPGLPARGEGRRHHPDLAARCALPERRPCAVRRLPQGLPGRLRRRRPGRIYHRETGGARRAASPVRRDAVHGRAEREGRERRPARPADAVLAVALRLQHVCDERAGRQGRAGRRHPHRDRGPRLQARLGIFVDRADASALRRRPRRRAPDLRPAAGGRRAHGLYAAWAAGWRGTFHAPLFPGGARGGARDRCARAGFDARGLRATGDRRHRRYGVGAGGLRAGRRQDSLRAGARAGNRPDGDFPHSHQRP